LKYAFNTLFLKRTDETMLGGSFLKNALAGICVSHEIEQYEKSRCKSYNTTVIANGVRVMQPVSLEHLPLNGTLRVCMIIGSPAIWHGYDRLLKGLSQLATSDIAVQLDIIGLNQPEEKLPEVPKPHCVKWWGPMSRPQIAEHIAGCHLAVGTLALHRKEMQEASPLKVRESLMMGLPMILGYYDTDISDDERFSDFILTVPNNDSSIDWQEVIDFTKRLDAQKDHRRIISGLATEVLSMEGKAARYVDFMRSLKN
jgi:glycosyltransferase involved in cell wall biosynthesis